MKKWIAIGLAAAVVGGLTQACSGMIMLPEGTIQIGDLFYVDTTKYTVDRSEENTVSTNPKRVVSGDTRTSTGNGFTSTAQQSTTRTFPGPVVGQSGTSATGSGEMLTIEVFELRDNGLYYLVERIADIPVLGGDEPVLEEVADVPPPPPPPMFVPVAPGEFVLPFQEPGEVELPEEAAPIDLEAHVVIS